MALLNPLPTLPSLVDWSSTYQAPSDIPSPLAPPRPDTATSNPLELPTFDPTTNNPLYGGVQINPNSTVTTNTVNGSQTGAATGLFAGIENWILSEQSNWAAIILGLVLVAGAVWSIGMVRDTVTTVARGAATIAE